MHGRAVPPRTMFVCCARVYALSTAAAGKSKPSTATPTTPAAAATPTGPAYGKHSVVINGRSGGRERHVGRGEGGEGGGSPRVCINPVGSVLVGRGFAY